MTKPAATIRFKARPELSKVSRLREMGAAGSLFKLWRRRFAGQQRAKGKPITPLGRKFAATIRPGATELVTSEMPGKPMFRVKEIRVVSLHSLA